MLIFATHNVIKDPPFTKLNIVMCRNMLIYMEAPLQKKLIELFNYSLLSGGIMILGSAEAISHNNEGFEVLDTKLKFYKRTHIIIRINRFSKFFSSKSENKEITNTPKVVEKTSKIRSSTSQPVK
jgi:two-component system CheB/CheR fusion protein